MKKNNFVKKQTKSDKDLAEIKDHLADVIDELIQESKALRVEIVSLENKIRLLEEENEDLRSKLDYY